MYLHSTVSVLLAVFGSLLLLFEALHSKVLPLSVLFPVIPMEIVLVPFILLFKYQVITGGGAAFWFTLHVNSVVLPSIIENEPELDCRDILWTATVKYVYNVNFFVNLI